MICLMEVENVSRILYQSMLEASSGTEERPSLLARKANPAQGTLHAAVRAPGGSPQRIERFKCPSRRSVTEFNGGNPGNGDGRAQSVSSVMQGIVCRPVGFRLRVEISDDPYRHHTVYSFNLCDLCHLCFAKTVESASKRSVSSASPVDRFGADTDRANLML